MKKELIFIGPPASGKGTQTFKLSKETGLPHIDTGSLLRDAIKNATEYGKIASTYIEQGNLVPCEIVQNVIKERLKQDDCKRGFILDGYPRSLEQATALDAILKEINGRTKVDLRVLYFDIPMDDLMERIVNRRSCPKCGAIFNVKTMQIKDSEHCDFCETELIQRSDDNEKIAKARFETFFKETAPLIDLYEKKGTLYKIEALGTVDEVFVKLKEAIK